MRERGGGGGRQINGARAVSKKGLELTKCVCEHASVCVLEAGEGRLTKNPKYTHTQHVRWS